MEGDFIVFPNKYFHTFIVATSTMDVVGLKGKERKKEIGRKINLKEIIVFPSFTESHPFLYLCCAGYHICAGYLKLGTALTN